MLSGEPFSDEPQCVCPVIAEFLRTYNDQVDNERRRDLFPYAALVVGTRNDHRAERERANKCLDWWLRTSTPRRRQLRRFLWMLPPSSAARDIEIAHRTARWAAASRERHAVALDLVEALAGASPLRIGVEPAAMSERAGAEPAAIFERADGEPAAVSERAVDLRAACAQSR